MKKYVIAENKFYFHGFFYFIFEYSINYILFPLVYSKNINKGELNIHEVVDLKIFSKLFK